MIKHNNNRTRVFIWNHNPSKESKHGFLALIRKVHYNNKEFVTLLLPGGGIDEGETLEQGLRREVSEEVGLVLEQVNLIDPVFHYTRPVNDFERWLWPQVDEVAHEFTFYSTSLPEGQEPKLKEPEKFLAMRWVQPHEVIGFAQEYNAVIGDGIMETLQSGYVLISSPTRITRPVD